MSIAKGYVKDFLLVLMEEDFTRSENIFYFMDNFTSLRLMENSEISGESYLVIQLYI